MTLYFFLSKLNMRKFIFFFQGQKQVKNSFDPFLPHTNCVRRIVHYRQVKCFITTANCFALSQWTEKTLTTYFFNTVKCKSVMLLKTRHAKKFSLKQLLPPIYYELIHQNDADLISAINIILRFSANLKYFLSQTV